MSHVLDDATTAESSYRRHGYALQSGLLPRGLIDGARGALLRAAAIIDPGLDAAAMPSIDAAWQHLVRKDRSLGGLLYNAAKLLPEIRALAAAPSLLEAARRVAGLRTPVVVDVNMRIDAPSESKFLFSWHQDYWFSICSPRSAVAWIPLTDLDDLTGGVEVMSLAETGGRIFKVRPAETYHSYSDSIVLDEPVDVGAAVRPLPQAGDVLWFRFDVLHRSRPNVSADRNRWTVQIRLADLEDPEFRREAFRPGVVTKDKITYLERVVHEASHAV
jgi:hypothetical protein